MQPRLCTVMDEAPFRAIRTRSFYMRKSLSVDNHLGSLSYSLPTTETKTERVKTKLRRQFVSIPQPTFLSQISKDATWQKLSSSPWVAVECEDGWGWFDKVAYHTILNYRSFVSYFDISDCCVGLLCWPKALTRPQACSVHFCTLTKPILDLWDNQLKPCICQK